MGSRDGHFYSDKLERPAKTGSDCELMGSEEAQRKNLPQSHSTCTAEASPQLRLSARALELGLENERGQGFGCTRSVSGAPNGQAHRLWPNQNTPVPSFSFPPSRLSHVFRLELDTAPLISLEFLGRCIKNGGISTVTQRRHIRNQACCKPQSPKRTTCNARLMLPSFISLAISLFQKSFWLRYYCLSFHLLVQCRKITKGLPLLLEVV